ncbi:hypothetical protein [Methylobacterium sp. 174MFSha1.1]|uniref:hypothetical protein n=1 Tax=Methylobacterium sp. 174MFSha1.1 TaxID=1502749 RepID=UPI0015A71EEF|nr:hypothetical protein [Methylobacterium sp. 174MFSha1.1]
MSISARAGNPVRRRAIPLPPLSLIMAESCSASCVGRTRITRRSGIVVSGEDLCDFLYKICFFASNFRCASCGPSPGLRMTIRVRPAR